MFDLNKCTETCFSCLKKYKKKHENDFKNANIKPVFKIKCDGIPKEYIDNKLLSSLSNIESEEALTLLDPVKWAEKNLDWYCLDPDGEIWKRKDPAGYYDWKQTCLSEGREFKSKYHRPYQAEILRCQSRRKVLRCVDPNTEITLENGQTRIIKDLKVGDRVISVDEKTLTSKISTILDIVSTGKKIRYKVKTKQGHEVIVSNDHPFLIKEGLVDKSHSYFVRDLPMQWKTIKQGLQAGDRIAICNNTSLFQQLDNLNITDDHLKILGYFITDGSYGERQSAKFTNNNSLYLDEFEICCNNLGSSCKRYSKSNGFDLIISNGRSVLNPVSKWLESIGCKDVVMEKRLLPNFIFDLSRRQAGLLLGRMWAGDGWVEVVKRNNRDTYRCSLGIASTALPYLKQIKALLLKFGINSYIKIESKKSYKGTRDFYKLHISKSKDILIFLELVGGVIFGKEKQSAIGKLIATQNEEKNKVKSEGVITWDHIKSIELLPADELFDLSLDTVHTFIANSSIILHNCGRQLGKTEVLMISMLYRLFIKPGISPEEGYHIVVITPFQSQIKLLFDGMLSLLKRTVSLNNSILHSVQSPHYTLELTNGSKVTGFTAGTKSGSGAASARGQHAHCLVYDESDYLNQSDMDATLAIITNYPNASVLMSSTPTGKRERFYETCQSMGWKEFFYPSSINPLWGDDMERTFRESSSSMGYKHEILAEFGEIEEGIFQHMYIEAAQSNYNYGDIAPDHKNWVYAIGVDWNDTANGTNISVLGLNLKDQKYYLLDRKIVSREGWTQTAGCDEVAKMNRFWQPEFIYVDKGHGSMNIEQLHNWGWTSLKDKKRGANHPDSNLRKVKGFGFGENIEVIDPFTKQPIPKAAKEFLVENAQRCFENQIVRYPASDKILTEQLQGYVINRISDTGRKSFKPGRAGDHLLDSLMLALVSFSLEKSAYGKIKHTNNVGFVPNINKAVPDEADTKSSTIFIQNENNKTENKPSTNRGDLKSSSPIPGGNQKDIQPEVGLWGWDGFSRDEPMPKWDKESLLSRVWSGRIKPNNGRGGLSRPKSRSLR